MFIPPLKKRVNVIRTNLALAMPELSEEDRESILRNNLAETGSFFTEAMYLSLKKTQHVDQHSDIVNFEVLEKAMASGKNVLLLSYHTTCIEVASMIITARADIDVIFRKQHNEVVDYLLYRHRSRHFRSLMNRDDIEIILKTCKDTSRQHIVWSVPDHDFGLKRSVFVPFLGYPSAATLTAPARLATSCDMECVFASTRFDYSLKKWVVELKEMPEFPTGDNERDACLMNAVFSEEIRKCPDQYYWVHRRFKTLSDGSRRDY